MGTWCDVVGINLQLGFNDVEQTDANVGIPSHGEDSSDVLEFSAVAVLTVTVPPLSV